MSISSSALGAHARALPRKRKAGVGDRLRNGFRRAGTVHAEHAGKCSQYFVFCDRSKEITMCFFIRAM
jgi:hypothetical protein